MISLAMLPLMSRSRFVSSERPEAERPFNINMVVETQGSQPAEAPKRRQVRGSQRSPGEATELVLKKSIDLGLHINRIKT